jgi:translation elongation factor EF-4
MHDQSEEIHCPGAPACDKYEDILEPFAREHHELREFIGNVMQIATDHRATYVRQNTGPTRVQ